MNNSIIQHFSRDPNNDNPVIVVVYSLVGNDVCNGYCKQHYSVAFENESIFSYFIVMMMIH